MSIAELSHLVNYFPLMAGGDVQVGQAIGETDDIVSAPVGEGFTPDDLAASFFRNIGIDPQTKYQTNVGRPVTLVRDGRPIQQLFRVFSDLGWRNDKLGLSGLSNTLNAKEISLDMLCVQCALSEYVKSPSDCKAKERRLDIGSHSW